MARDIDPEEIARLLTLKPVRKEDAEQMGMKEHLLKNYPEIVQQYVDRNQQDNEPSSAAEAKVNELFKQKQEEAPEKKEMFPGLKNLFNKSNEDRKKDIDAFLMDGLSNKQKDFVKNPVRGISDEDAATMMPAIGATKAVKVFGPMLGKAINKASKYSNPREIPPNIGSELYKKFIKGSDNLEPITKEEASHLIRTAPRDKHPDIDSLLGNEFEKQYVDNATRGDFQNKSVDHLAFDADKNETFTRLRDLISRRRGE